MVAEYEICDVCLWENDPAQLWKPSQSGGANMMSLDEARQAFRAGKKVQ